MASLDVPVFLLRFTPRWIPILGLVLAVIELLQHRDSLRELASPVCTASIWIIAMGVRSALSIGQAGSRATQ